MDDMPKPLDIDELECCKAAWLEIKDAGAIYVGEPLLDLGMEQSILFRMDKPFETEVALPFKDNGVTYRLWQTLPAPEIIREIPWEHIPVPDWAYECGLVWEDEE